MKLFIFSFVLFFIQAEGYAIWIDIEKMGGSTLEAMAHAVENAAVVLICMSEKYKQSPNCRTGMYITLWGRCGKEFGFDDI